MRNWITGVMLSFSAAVGAQALPIPDALEVQARVAQQDVAALQAYFSRYQHQYEADPATERPLIQLYWALMRETDAGLATLYDRWVNTVPNSYEARMARAMYRWGQADLIAEPVAYQGVNADRAWQDYRSLMQQAREDVEASLKLTARPLVSYRVLIALCDAMRDGPCVEQAFREGVAQAPHSLALRRGYIAAIASDSVHANVIADARAQGMASDHLKVLEAEKQLSDSRKIMRADGGTEVAIHESIAQTVQDPWLDQRIGHMFYRRSFYPRALEFYSRALAGNPNLDGALYWRARTYFEMGDLLAGRADMMRAALMGNPQANRHLIDQHVQASNGAARDEVAMTRWCGIAARRGQAYGAFCLGDVYANGYAGYPRDREKSLAWTRLAAERGMPMAQHDLGVMQLKGLGIPQDRAAGIGWLKLSAQGGFEYAERKLRLHLSAWEYFKELTWPAYREAFQHGNLNVRMVVNLLIEMVRAAFS
ncbi:MAG: hypothetical protein Q7J36_02585 [Thiobacillus sp.]|nr:hypothetical protein [Thiobacillus sp.]